MRPEMQLGGVQEIPVRQVYRLHSAYVQLPIKLIYVFFTYSEINKSNGDGLLNKQSAAVTALLFFTHVYSINTAENL